MLDELAEHFLELLAELGFTPQDRQDGTAPEVRVLRFRCGPMLGAEGDCELYLVLASDRVLLWYGTNKVFAKWELHRADSLERAEMVLRQLPLPST